MGALLLEMMSIQDPTMMTKACEDLKNESFLSPRPRYNKALFVPMGGMPALLSVLKTHCEDASVNQTGWETVKWLIRDDVLMEDSDIMKDVFVKEGFMPVLVAALTYHCQHLGVIKVACNTAFF